MYNDISQFEPLIPNDLRELEELAYRLVEASAKLEARLAKETLSEIAKLLRVVNSYYSNLIEGHNTHPIDIQHAMRKEYSADDARRDLQIESVIHIEVQEKILERLEAEPEINVAAPEFLLWIHEKFYEKLPERLRWIEGDGEKQAWVEAGKLRDRHVIVGRHIPPEAESLERFLNHFSEFYDPGKMNGLHRMIALAAAHHRLMWIHPFLDGNGRVVRLFTDAYFHRCKFSGYGLWNVSRGLARRRDDYQANLAAADFPREGDLDGRGNLSNRTLTEFCRFFLEICIDQAEYMNSMLSLEDFLKRLATYVERRNAGLIIDESGKPLTQLPSRTAEILKQAAINGVLARGDVFKIVGMSERTGRNVLKTLLDEGLLTADSDWHKSPVKLAFPAQFAANLFPNLFPEDV